jgi:hypothetical protein
VDFLVAFLGGTATPLPEAAHARPRPEARVLDLTREQVRRTLEIPSAYFISRGFTAETLDGYDVGHSAKLGRSVVPVYDDAGEACVTFMARAENETSKPKWTTLDGSAKGRWVYNLANARRSPSPILLVVEGSGDVWRAAEAGYTAVALLGSDITSVQAKKINALGKEVLLMLDNDKTGKEASWRISDRLRRCMDYRCILAPYKDLGEVPLARAIRMLDAEVSPDYRPVRAAPKVHG